MVRVVDWVIESEEYSLGVRRLNAACVATGIEGGKQAVRKQLAVENFDPVDPSAAKQSAQVMHAAIKVFLETDFASYLRLDELDLAGLCQLCLDS
ncbi:unnamed protein product [Lactuca virosa]|uniref:Uncharacterized protein n=1 Tax=Lactuca virosa TaxID=75947 RepID=A0AAU9N731_9ASTR|nr:unnamed protein product [Lactuca virosa]